MALYAISNKAYDAHKWIKIGYTSSTDRNKLYRRYRTSLGDPIIKKFIIHKFALDIEYKIKKELADHRLKRGLTNQLSEIYQYQSFAKLWRKCENIIRHITLNPPPKRKKINNLRVKEWVRRGLIILLYVIIAILCSVVLILLTT